MRRSTWKKLAAACLAGAMFLGIGGRPFETSARGEVTPDQVDEAIQKAKEFLYGQQAGDGSFGEVGGAHGPASLHGGYTVIATYGLLASGESPQDPRLQKAIDWLMKADINLIYSLGLRAQVWTFMPEMNKQLKEALNKDGATLLGAMGPTGKFNYSTTMGDGDQSVSQYGVLGLWAIAQMGGEIPTKVWETIDAGWRGTQGPDGTWGYGAAVPSPANPGKASITAAGVATLFITQDYLRYKEGINCNGNIKNPNIEAGIKWLGDNFAQVNDLYTWYGIERIGVASGLKYFGKVDWYKVGSDTLVKQQAGGSWNTHGVIPGTAWGLVFLSRGRAPVVMNKLEYSIVAPVRPGAKDKEPVATEGHWNQRPRDAANATKFVAKSLERDLNWQIVSLKAPVADLHDAPILYMAGDEPVNFTDEDKAKLKEFIDGGGIILGNADCDNAKFATAFKKLGKSLYPAYEFEEMDKNHPIFKNQMFPAAKFKTNINLLAMDNGARVLMLLVPRGDPGKFWQSQGSGGKEDLFQILVNIFLYSIDKQDLRFKGETYIVNRDPTITADRLLSVARLQYDGNWNPEPGGWVRLSNYIHNTAKLDVTADDVKLGDGKLVDYKVAHMTGTKDFKLKPAERDELKAFVSAGGTLIIDAAGGSGAFSQAAEAELTAMFPDGIKELQEPLKVDNDIYKAGPSPITQVGYRTFASRHLVTDLRLPRIRGMQINGRTAILFSKEDLSVGIVGQPVDGIIGYQPNAVKNKKDKDAKVPAGATELMSNILLYAAATASVPATQPVDAAAAGGDVKAPVEK